MSKRAVIEITDPAIVAFYAKLDAEKERRERGNYVIKTPEMRAKIREIEGGLFRLKQAFDPRFHAMLPYRQRYRELTRELRLANETMKKLAKRRNPRFKEPPVSKKLA